MRNLRFSYAIFSLLLIFFATSSNAQSEVSEKEAEGLCKTVKSIKELPRDWGDKGVDRAYDAIVDAGEKVVPCLIDQVIDVTVMKDPRCPPISSGTTIGDVSYFILVDLLKIEFTQLLPENVVAEFKTRGVYAYHDYIDRDGSRKELQSKIREWWKIQKKRERN
jgi:hypothetical protein